MFLESLLKYVGYEWKINNWGTIARMTVNNIPYIKISELLLLLLMIFFVKIKKSYVTVSGILLIVIGFFWSVMAIEQVKVLMYLNSTPVLLIEFGLLFIIGQDEDVFKHALEFSAIAFVFYTVLCTISCIFFSIYYPNMRMADGYIIEYFATSIILAYVYIMRNEMKGKNNKLLYLLSVMLIFCSIIITSRGWMIQSIILFLFVYLSTSKQSVIEKVKKIFFCLMVFIVAIIILNNYFNDALTYILNRFGEDTRSSQIVTFFEQISFENLILGQGYNAKYFMDGQLYAYIDNQIIFLCYRYGIYTVFIYLLPFVISLFKSHPKNIHSKAFLSYKMMIITWFLMLIGMAIYYSFHFDFAQSMQLIVVAYLTSNKRCDLNERENQC